MDADSEYTESAQIKPTFLTALLYNRGVSTEKKLSPREMEILSAMAEPGSRHESVAASLSLSISTVRFHLGNAYDKLGVTDLLAALYKAGIVERVSA